MEELKRMEVRKVNFHEKYFLSPEKNEEALVLSTMPEGNIEDIKIDEKYMNAFEGSLENQVFSEDDTELELRIKEFKEELANINIPKFKMIWKAHSCAFNEQDITHKTIFRSVPSVQPVSTKKAVYEDKRIITSAQSKKERLGEELCTSIDIDYEH